MRQTRYQTYTVEQRRTIQSLVCDNCGSIVDIEPLSRPEPWASVQFSGNGQKFAYDFCSWECLYGFVLAHEEPSYLDAWERSIEQIQQQRAEQAADNILSGVE